MGDCVLREEKKAEKKDRFKLAKEFKAFISRCRLDYYYTIQ